MTEDSFRKFALSLPHTHEEPHMDRTSFRVKKRIFATLVPGGDEAMVYAKPPAVAQSLIDEHPDMFFAYGGFTTKMGCLGVRLSRAKDKFVEQLLRTAHEGVSPEGSVGL